MKRQTITARVINICAFREKNIFVYFSPTTKDLIVPSSNCANMRYQYPAVNPFVLPLYTYCWLVLSHLELSPGDAASLYMRSPMLALRGPSCCGGIQRAARVQCPTVPSALLIGIL